MAMRGTIEQGSPSTDERGAERLLLNLEVEGSIDSGGATTVLVHNLSVSGMLVETRSDLAMGQQIKVGLPETGEVSATIVWRSETLYGCRFDRPLPRAALSAARLRNPLPSDFDPALGDIAAEEAREPLAARLRRLREERGLSLAGLASRAGLSKPSIWAWESGKTAPRIRSLQAIATALGVSDDELLMGRGPEGDSTGFADHGGGGGPGAPALQTVVETSRRRIAQAAGVDAGRVKVTIEL
ncbi:MAG: helix-turn-helix domain-containing protein [Sphingopyxis sp.]|uniref:helix-turn-helix domain-containing protein n=1 Tax=Sphingopyxis sp. TaxID=1908224 RepID=UPI002AB85C5C|nr:helix-turn-helix domain-containing protein [Sphingopyxis sp.]MDZ3832165.1 helix-turn-helix domain-containing protein [Sphingopyxis sp.]